jgi:hypothetical protein
MGDFSFKSIRSFAVTTGNAANYQSMSLAGLDPEATVNPDRANVSDSGVAGVPRDSINTLTVGFSPLDRMTDEGLLRPQYSTYLNADAINMPGVGSDDLAEADYENQVRSNYDTQLGYQYVRRQAVQAPQYKLSQFKPRFNVSAFDKDVLQENCIMRSGKNFQGSCAGNQ